ncbi:uncharacterized protein C7orf50 homolog [Culicoides brevitarsis]|uniref:uncharacterized protein C7orf50 homolog n=1 Tax=Culicoides brevitarsis TaxID=469753 RepID=UPI00307BB0BD
MSDTKMEKKEKKRAKKRKQTEEDGNDNNSEDDAKPKKSKELASVDQMHEVVKLKAALETTHESKRSKKRKKYNEKIEKSTNIRADKKFLDEIAAYLTKWETDKDSWKFQKVKQMFIQNNVFNDKIISDDIWHTTLSYLGSSRGKAKELLKENAQKVIEKVDADFESSQNKELLQQKTYTRARELLQMLE